MGAPAMAAEVEAGDAGGSKRGMAGCWWPRSCGTERRWVGALANRPVLVVPVGVVASGAEYQGGMVADETRGWLIAGRARAGAGVVVALIELNAGAVEAGAGDDGLVHGRRLSLLVASGLYPRCRASIGGF